MKKLTDNIEVIDYVYIIHSYNSYYIDHLNLIDLDDLIKTDRSYNNIMEYEVKTEKRMIEFVGPLINDPKYKLIRIIEGDIIPLK